MAYNDTEWWRDYFSGEMLALWRTIIPPSQAIEDADFLTSHCNIGPGMRVLDVPCGEGRVAIELASRGMFVTGLDISLGQIELAKAHAVNRNVSVDWLVGDMRNLPGVASFDAAFCWGDSFGYMDDASNREFLTGVGRSLKPAGRWAMEMQMVEEILLPRLQLSGEGNVGEFRVKVRRNYDSQLRRLAVEYDLERRGRRITKQASYRIYSCDEIRELLAGANFRIDGLYSPNGTPYSEEADRLRVVCTSLH